MHKLSICLVLCVVVLASLQPACGESGGPPPPPGPARVNKPPPPAGPARANKPPPPPGPARSQPPNAGPKENDSVGGPPGK